MTKNIVSIFFSIVFMVSISAPTVIYIMDDSVDISLLLTSNDDEEKEGEISNDKEVLFLESLNNEVHFSSKKAENNLVYFFKKYTKPHLNLIFPPPELYI